MKRISRISNTGFQYRVLPFLLFCMLSSFVFAQSPPSPSRYKTFTSLKTALVQPDSVFWLDLSKNKLREIPADIFKLKNLRILDLSKNQISEIPAAIGDLQNLEELDLSKNKLSVIPPEIGKLAKLRYLCLNRNRLEKIPAEFGLLKNLESLDLWSNELSGLPEEMRNLPNLHLLEMRGILFSAERQEQIRGLLPNTTIFFSPSCACKM